MVVSPNVHFTLWNSRTIMWRTDLSLGVNLLTQRQNGWFGGRTMDSRWPNCSQGHTKTNISESLKRTCSFLEEYNGKMQAEHPSPSPMILDSSELGQPYHSRQLSCPTSGGTSQKLPNFHIFFLCIQNEHTKLPLPFRAVLSSTQ